jgi:aspartyl-tRNA(Asn)/glutamyl-tRNA(Gln) amidotransferase subunit B
MQWETVIGLEVHAQLTTKTKIFSGSATAYGAAPNTQASAVDLAMPGTLPVFNKEALQKAVSFGVAIGAQVNKRSVFARKNYFYPDLPKGYQISQMDLPIVGEGELEITLEDGTVKTIGVTRAHLEEDAGKSLHEDFQGCTGIDLNRAGTPLLEIVSEPDMCNAKEAVAYLKTLHTLVRYLGICDGNMQEGSFRCDANVSVRPVGQKELGTRAELKNINSFRFVERAINLEVERQIELIEDGGTVIQETRLYDADKHETRSMRLKVEANDYRYFPCPDLLPVEIDDSYINAVRDGLPELPQQKKQRFINDFGLSAYDSSIIVANQDMAVYFESVTQETQAPAKLAANWVMGELSAALNKNDVDISNSPISAKALAQLLDRITDNTISGKIAKTVFEHMWDSKENADTIIEQQGLKQVTDSSAIEAIVDAVITNNPNQLEQYRSGKDKLFGFFVGQVMKESKGKANPAQVNDLLKKKLM